MVDANEDENGLNKLRELRAELGRLQRDLELWAEGPRAPTQLFKELGRVNDAIEVELKKLQK